MDSPDALSEKVRQLERRLSELEARGSQAGAPAHAAPFRVVDEGGRTIFELTSENGQTRALFFSPGTTQPGILVLVNERGHGIAALGPDGRPVECLSGSFDAELEATLAREAAPAPNPSERPGLDVEHLWARLEQKELLEKELRRELEQTAEALRKAQEAARPER